MAIELFVFYFLAFIAVGSAALLVAMRNIVRSLFLFFLTLFALAGLYVFALADFVALAQVIIYVGGVLVLMLFAFMLSNKTLLNDVKEGTFGLPRWPALLVVILLGTIMGYTFLQFASAPPQWIRDAEQENRIITTTDNTVHYLGVNTMTRYLLPFELVSVFLMMALMGAAHMARKGGKS
ncbi:NADH-quinone oxidoreductase subunit J family protein [Olivibacter sitiensis]|uniref:NADH-quinone oxidoreductase subunit J family protein n=1 Tax=Olivibacter sitiensis TaxID=376470 RepID=UPI00040D1B01|nr:NADH-quinone oxidoreductase subunit J [Olivibacter sitiensis]